MPFAAHTRLKPWVHARVIESGRWTPRVAAHWCGANLTLWSMRDLVCKLIAGDVKKRGAASPFKKHLYIYIYILLNLYILIYFRAPGKGTTKAGDTFSNSFPVVPLHIKVRNGDCDGGMELGRRPGLSCCGKLTAKLRYIFVLAMFVYDLLFQFPFEPRLSNLYI